MSLQRSGKLKRTSRLKRGKGLKRGEPLNAFSKKRWDAVTATGRFPCDSFTPRPAPAKAKASRSTAPKRSVCGLVDKRSRGMCEWPGCPRRGVDRHHRLNRKVGGRHGEMAELVNGAAWLLKVCRFHHGRVTSAFGEVLEQAKRWGWVLVEGQNALRVPVLTRHDEQPVWLLPDGKWLRFEEACV